MGGTLIPWLLLEYCVYYARLFFDPTLSFIFPFRLIDINVLVTFVFLI